jgi:hypothetical protein
MHIVVHTNICLFVNKLSLHSELFSIFGVHVCTLFLRMFSIVGRMSGDKTWSLRKENNAEWREREFYSQINTF